MYCLFISRYDLYDNEMIPNILAYKPPWSAEYSQIVRGSKADDVGM